MKNYKRNILIFTGLGSLFLLQGCIASQTDIGVLKTQVAALNKTLQDMQRNQVSVDQQLEDVTTQLTKTVENLNEFDYKLSAISTKLDNISTQLSSKEGAQQYQMLPGDIYKEAKSQYDSALYDSAVKGFALYLKTSPEGENAQEAYYYLSDSYYNQKEYQKAAVAVATLLDKYPQSKLTASARILYAKCILPLNKKEEAQTYLKSVIQDFKDTPEAQNAQNLLKEAN